MSSKKYHREHYKANRIARILGTVQSRRKRRARALEALGNKCVRCGFDDPRALQIDHVNGGGTAARLRDSRESVSEVIKGILEPYQLLCANCNWIKREERKEYNKCTISI